jgi:hypothetical protein
MPGPGEISGHLRITRIPTVNLFGVGQSWLTQHKTLRLDGGLRRKVEAAMLPEEVIVMLSLDKAARLEPATHRPDAAGLRRDVGLGIPRSREQAADA